MAAQRASTSSWRTNSSEYAKPQYNLQHTMSMVNLHEEPNWYNRGPPSPTASSVSSCTSRSTTPTSSQTNNPWANVMPSPASTYSSKSTSSTPNTSPLHTPKHASRSTTPIAPQPRRPINPAGFVPMSGELFRNNDYPGSPYPGSPNPYRQPVSPFSPLVNGFINAAQLSSQGQSLSGWFLEQARKHFADQIQIRKVWQWTLSNPRLAILMYVCDDVASWRQAAFFDLRDENLPFPEERLQGIVASPRRVVDEQWRATSKELPLNGNHVDFGSRENVPLQHVSLIRTSRGPEKSVDRVRMLPNSDDRILIRTRFVTTRPAQKATLLAQIASYRKLEHKNICQLLCSYAQPNHVGILVARAQYTLDEYMTLPGSSPNRPKQFVDWMFDLSHALDYLHAQGVYHRNIRPRKILIDGSRVLFAPFGIKASSDSYSPSGHSPERPEKLSSYFEDQSYIYGAPETSESRAKKPADVFSLGCVFLSMMTVAQGQSLAFFAEVRAGSSQDASFRNNLDRVASWRHRLLTMITSNQRNSLASSGRKVRQLKVESDWLHIIEEMMKFKPKERIKISTIVHEYKNEKVIGSRRRSMDGGGYSGQAAAVPPPVTLTRNGIMKSNGTGASGYPQKPELSIFDGYFQSQLTRKHEPVKGW